MKKEKYDKLSAEDKFIADVSTSTIFILLGTAIGCLLGYGVCLLLIKFGLI
jgi:hypothetical protein